MAKVKIGDYVQWTSGGADQFLKLRRVIAVSSCEEYVQVEGSLTGIPVAQISQVFHPSTGLKEYKV